jgi:hypothetical protein
VRYVDAAWKGVNILVGRTLGLEQAVTAGQHDIGSPKQLALQLGQLRRCAGKSRQLIHALVDDGSRRESIRELQCHRCVVPQHELVDVMFVD